MTSFHDPPQLKGEAAKAVAHRGGHIQIIAAAGSGKTETVSQRIARLIGDGVPPEAIVAFTFTERAANELKLRIRERVAHFVNSSAADQLGTMYVGTIHGYCFQLLTRHVSHYENYSVLDENQLAAFIQRNASLIKVKDLVTGGGLFDGIAKLRESINVIENEMLSLESLPEPLRGSVARYYQLLDEYRFLTFGRQINAAVQALCDAHVHEVITSGLSHLVVDEYQDVNPAQEELIRLLARPEGRADLVVVGDDDQAIYQWRGSSVANITSFTERYPDVTTFSLMENRRSRPPIVALANAFAATIPGRLDKQMLSSRDINGPAVDIVADFDTESIEADEIAMTIQRLRTNGYRYSDMAILVRGKVAYPAILNAFERHGVPVQPGGRAGLFTQPDADFLGRCIAWLVGYEWRKGRYGNNQESVSLSSLETLARALYSMDMDEWSAVSDHLLAMQGLIGRDSRNINLVDEIYALIDLLGVKNWDLDDPLRVARLGTIARFQRFIADYESVQMRARVTTEGQVGASDQGEYYFTNLAALLLNVALNDYTDFEGEEDLETDSVELMTVHGAKGLEWPVVFLPSLTARRFPSSNAGKSRDWIVPTHLFDSARYEGGDSEERRLFYVAMTRAREWLSMSAHQRVNVRTAPVSPYILEALELHRDDLDFPPPWISPTSAEPPDLVISFSDLASYLTCGYSYWLRSRLGFPPPLVEEIGYGNAVHHLMRVIAEETRRRNSALGPRDIDRLLATHFFLPFANKTVADRFRTAAGRLITRYMNDFSDDMLRVWETERPFELALPGVVISGRADVILDRENGVDSHLAIVDYKTEVDERDLGLQLQVYCVAGLREGLSVDGAYLHDLKTATRTRVDTSADALESAVNTVTTAAVGIRNKSFIATPEARKCNRCDVQSMCSSRAD